MSVYISGGCKNGKSTHAQRIAKALGSPLYYVATMIPRDEEDRARVRRHIGERAGWGFQTIECGCSILSCLSQADTSGAFLIDSVTALLSNEMFPPDGSVDLDAPRRIANELAQFVARAPRTVLVSDYIFSDAAIYPELVEAYRRGLAEIDRRVAGACDALIEVASGIAIFHKGAATW
jgi:adenosylcobinamide kinase/adenosylcobinamide-phosphate guanylyltransferase